MPEYTIKDLEEQAQKAMDKFEPAIAMEFYRRIFELEPTHETATQIGILCCQLQRIEESIDWFKKSIDLNSLESKSYFPLAQVLEATEAVEVYHLGLQSMRQRELNEQDKRIMSSALCALTEIYMTDLCTVPEAEEKCELFMNEAITTDDTNPEVYSTFASVRLSQCRPEDALEYLLKGMSLWYTPKENEDAIPEYNNQWPSLTVRLSFAKLFMECGDYTQAVLCLETCEVEEDEDYELWYLYGWCYMNLAKDNESYYEDAKESLETVLQLYEKNQGTEDEPNQDIMEHTQAMLDEINTGDVSMEQ